MLSLNYLNFLIKIKYFVLLFVLISTIFFVFNLDSQSISNDEREWIHGSEEHKKLIESDQSELLGKKVFIKIDIDNLDLETFEKLQELNNYLSTLELNGGGVNSIFNHMFSLKMVDEESSFVELTTLSDIDNGYELFQNSRRDFLQYFWKDGVVFYIFSKDNIHLENLPTDLEYEIQNLISEKKFIEESVLLIGLGVILTILLTIFFKSFSAPILGITFIVITSTATIYVFKLFMGDYTPHISILILSFSISFMDFLYIYYRWFMLQQKRTSFYAINRTIERTFTPIFFTTVVNTFGIGSLIFVDSSILQSLGLMVIISSIVGLLYSFIFLPIIFSFITVDDPHTGSENFSRIFSEKIENYSPLLLKLFSILTLSLFLVSMYKIYTGFYHVSTEHSSKVVKLSLDYPEIDINSLKAIEKVDQLLNIDEVKHIVSPYHAIKSLYEKESRDSFNLDNIDLDRYIFMLDMFGSYDSLFNAGRVKVDIYLKNSQDKSRVINIIQDNNLDIYITDIDTLLQSAKIETINVMVGLVFLIIIVISVVIYLMTRTLSYSILGIVVSIIPIIWFFSAVTALDYPISTEMFVAMIIAVAISSDATIHLLHYYYTLDSESRFDVDGVRKLFLYVESPLILGNIILAITFFLMIIANITSIMLIGIFSAMIVLLSLFTDIFILPVVILESRKH